MSFSDLINLAKRLLPALGVVLLVAATTCGYTIVMRGGKRIEIPGQFGRAIVPTTAELSPGDLDNCFAYRFGLDARFRALEDEARLAGVPRLASLMLPMRP